MFYRIPAHELCAYYIPGVYTTSISSIYLCVNVLNICLFCRSIHWKENTHIARLRSNTHLVSIERENTHIYSSIYMVTNKNPCKCGKTKNLVIVIHIWFEFFLWKYSKPFSNFNWTNYGPIFFFGFNLFRASISVRKVSSTGRCLLLYQLWTVGNVISAKNAFTIHKSLIFLYRLKSREKIVTAKWTEQKMPNFELLRYIAWSSLCICCCCLVLLDAFFECLPLFGFHVVAVHPTVSFSTNDEQMHNTTIDKRWTAIQCNATKVWNICT